MSDEKTDLFSKYMEAELYNCPWCGGEAGETGRHFGPISASVSISCYTCEAQWKNNYEFGYVETEMEGKDPE